MEDLVYALVAAARGALVALGITVLAFVLATLPWGRERK